MLVAMLPLAAILFYNLYAIRAAKEEDLHAEASRSGQLASLEMQRILDGLKNAMFAISAAPPVQKLDVPACNSYMKAVANRMPQLAGIAVLDARGVIRCMQEPGGLGVSLAEKDYFKQAIQGSFAVGEYTIGALSGEKVLPVAVPITDPSGKITGVVAGSLALDWLQKSISDRKFAANSSLTVADRDGVIIARHPQPEKFVGVRIPDKYQFLVHSDRPGTIAVTSKDGAERILAYFPPVPGQTDLYVSSGFSIADEYSAIMKATYFGVAVMVIAIIIAFVLAWSTGRLFIRRPIERLLATVDAWRRDDIGARTGMTARSGEFGLLGEAIDIYMDELSSARAQRQRDEEQRELLVGELDHRVKNLLATVQAVARQSFRSADIDPAATEIFNRRLAAMGEAHSLLMKGDWHSASMAMIVATAIGPFENADASQFDISGAGLTIQSKGALALSMALHELCTNAVKYGALSTDRGRVAITWSITARQDEPTLVLEWLESGGPPAAEPERTGFGSTMIDRILVSQIGGAVTKTYEATGLHFTLEAPLKGLQQVN